MYFILILILILMRERERETLIWERNKGCLLHVSWLGLKLVTFDLLVTGCGSNWATPARADFLTFWGEMHILHSIFYGKEKMLFDLSFFNPDLRICSLIPEREEWKEREKNQCERNIDWLPPTHAPSGDWTCNPRMCPDQKLNSQPYGARMMLQPAEPPGQGTFQFFLSCYLEGECAFHYLLVNVIFVFPLLFCSFGHNSFLLGFLSLLIWKLHSLGTCWYKVLQLT